MSEIYRESCHFYAKDGTPAYTQPKKGGGIRPTTIRDARKLGLLPSVTTILGCMAKPGLDYWKQRNAIHAALTTPRLDGENEDAFCERILASDVHSVSDAAKERGTQIHAAIEIALGGKVIERELEPFVTPVLASLKSFGKVVQCEKSIVGNGYAGKLDALFDDGEWLTVVDFKTCSKLPDSQYDEHLLQLAAYVAPVVEQTKKKARSCNIYIDSANAGAIKVITNTPDELNEAYGAFFDILKFWQWKNSYKL